jgi:hypothetical protein
LKTIFGGPLWSTSVITSGSQTVNGYLDDFRIYNRVLNTTEIGWLYNYSKYVTIVYQNSNYQLFNNLTTGNIFQRYLKAYYTSLPKTYNANTQGESTYTISGISWGDIIDISNIYLTNFATTYVGSNIPVYISNVNLIGDDYFNYVMFQNYD